MNLQQFLRRLAGAGILFLVLTGCGTNPASQAYAQAGSRAPGSRSEAYRLSRDGETLLRGYLNSAHLPDLHWPNFLNYQKEVNELYDSCGGALPWIREGKPTEQALDMIASFQAAALKGLRPEDYDGPLWDERLNRLERAPSVPESDLVKFDLALTVSTMRYVSDLHIGRVNPREFHFGLDIDDKQSDLSEFLIQRLINAADMNAVLKTVEPPFPIYRRTEEALKKYMDFARRDDGDPLPLPSRPVKPRGAYAGVPRLARLLLLLGDLPEEQSRTNESAIYQGALVDAVKHFQARHGLEPNGILDAPTVNEMNIPLSRRVTQIQLAMERMRWLPHRFERPPIVVNIPEFRL